jgi:hypothetical protein
MGESVPLLYKAYIKRIGALPTSARTTGTCMGMRATHGGATVIAGVLATAAVAAAPAIDCAIPLPHPCSMPRYVAIVPRCAGNKIYGGAYARRQKPAVADAPGGSALVQPPEDRRVPIQSGYSAHGDCPSTRAACSANGHGGQVEWGHSRPSSRQAPRPSTRPGSHRTSRASPRA